MNKKPTNRKRSTGRPMPINRSLRSRNAGDDVVKKMTLSSQSSSTNAGGVILVNSTTTAALVQSQPAAEWASFAARYQQFRVRSVSIRMVPAFTDSQNLVVNQSQLYVADFIGTAAPTTAAQVLSDERSLMLGTHREFSFTCSWVRNPNAKLWNPTSAALPAANSFGIAFASSTVAGLLAASVVHYTFDVVWVVEFRGSQ